MAQLGARFHGMEEVIGSIPIRSTKYLNNLAEPLPNVWQQIGSKLAANFKLPCSQAMSVVSVSSLKRHASVIPGNSSTRFASPCASYFYLTKPRMREVSRQTAWKDCGCVL